MGVEDSRPELFYAFVARSWADAPSYIAVSAIDFAGNESPRSKVFALNIDNGGGCGCHLQRTHRPAAALPLATLAMLAWARRRARPRRGNR